MRTEEEALAELTIEQARFVRTLRVDQGHTWRGVADECAMAWEGDWDADQGLGRELCVRAAALFDEDGLREPWN
jgi:hypothetical protein